MAQNNKRAQSRMKNGRPEREPQASMWADSAAHEVLLRSDLINELPPEDSVLREFISDFSAANALMRRLRASLASSLGLSAAGHSVLLGLWYCERHGETTVRELADHLHVAAAHVTAEIGNLLKRGLVSKVPSERDKRAVSVRLSKEGRELLKKLAPILKEVNVSLFAGVHYSEMIIVHRFLKRIVNQAPEAIQVAKRHARSRRRVDSGG
jgi:DNA-binding MarR family transcriptional regulator